MPLRSSSRTPTRSVVTALVPPSACVTSAASSAASSSSVVVTVTVRAVFQFALVKVSALWFRVTAALSLAMVAVKLSPGSPDSLTV